MVPRNNSNNHAIPSVTLDELPTKTQNEYVLYVVLVLGFKVLLNSYAAQGECHSNTRARGANHPLDNEHGSERDAMPWSLRRPGLVQRAPQIMSPIAPAQSMAMG